MNARQSPLPTSAYATRRHEAAGPRRSRSEKMTVTLVTHLSLLALLLTVVIAPVTALFDPGEPAPAQTAERAVLMSSTPHQDKAADQQSAKAITDLVSLVREPVSLHPDCRKVTDLFDNVCPNPWTPWSTSASVPRSELVICPLPGWPTAGHEAGAGPRERVYAITGTITLPNHILSDLSSSVSAAGKHLARGIAAERSTRQWPNPGDEGFWRQRDEGEVEWVPTEPRALLEADPTQKASTGTSAAPRSDDDASLPPPEQLAEAVQAKEYDAWSERIGGEESDTWLGFEQWRDKHLTAEREKAEHERHRIAANKKHKSEKTKASAQSDTPDKANAALPGHTVADQRAGEDGLDDRSNGTAAASVSSSPESDGIAPDTSDKNIEQQSREPLEVTEAVTTEQGAIPALGNPSDELGNLKHRWNFASLDCAAVVHRTNPSAKFSSSILSEKKDRYLLSPCSASTGEQQFVIVELCDEIKIDTLVMANFEFFSRMFKRFRVRVSRNLNGGDDEWVDLGTFRARNVRSLQVFKTVNPSGDARFFRYVRIDFLEHYGSEYYCPLSLLRVYGLTQMDDYIREEEEMRKAREAESRMFSEEAAAEDNDEGEEGSTVDVKSSEQIAPPQSTAVVGAGSPTSELPVSEGKDSVSASAASVAPSEDVAGPARTSDDALADELHSTAVGQSVPVTASESARNASSTARAPDASLETPSPVIQRAVSDAFSTSSSILPPSVATFTERNAPANATSRLSTESAMSSHNQTSSLPPASRATNATAAVDKALASDSPREETASPSVSPLTGSAALPSSSATSVQYTASSSQLPPAAPSSSSGGNSTVAQQQHGGSESIYRTITKRLNMLEANASLSQQYMEHTRQSLRETFARMERNQHDKIGQMLRELNASNWRQIESLKRRQQVDLQQALFEFDMHRQQTDAERKALLAQVRLLSNEIMLEKRFGIAQLMLLLGLFVFMALTRGSRASPLINQGLARLSRTSSSMHFNGGGGSHSHQRWPKRGSTGDSLRSSDDASSSPSSENRRQRGRDDQHHTSARKRRAAALPSEGDRIYADVPRTAARGILLPSRGQADTTHGNRSNARRNGGAGMLEYVVRMRGGINAKAPLQRRGRILIPSGGGIGEHLQQHARSLSIDEASVRSVDETEEPHGKENEFVL